MSGFFFQIIYVVVIGFNIKIVDLEGKFVIFGFIDLYVYFISGGFQVCGLDVYYCVFYGFR